MPWLSQELVDQTEREVVEPILHHLNSLGMPFHGVLFSGLMVQDGKPYCLEYNVRFGDPETQSVMMRLGSGFGAALAAVAGSQPVPDVEVLPDAAVTVVAASGGYPGDYEKGKPIRLPEALPENAQIFHAGTALSDDRLVTAGGRVLAVSARGSDVPAARALAYETLNQVQFEGMHFRRDIARH